jgi:hypothetical protein
MTATHIYTCEFCGTPYRLMWRLFEHRAKEHQEEIDAKVADPFARFERWKP